MGSATTKRPRPDLPPHASSVPSCAAMRQKWGSFPIRDAQRSEKPNYNEVKFLLEMPQEARQQLGPAHSGHRVVCVFVSVCWRSPGEGAWRRIRARWQTRCPTPTRSAFPRLAGAVPTKVHVPLADAESTAFERAVARCNHRFRSNDHNDHPSLCNKAA